MKILGVLATLVGVVFIGLLYDLAWGFARLLTVPWTGRRRQTFTEVIERGWAEGLTHEDIRGQLFRRGFFSPLFDSTLSLQMASLLRAHPRPLRKPEEFYVRLKPRFPCLVFSLGLVVLACFFVNLLHFEHPVATFVILAVIAPILFFFAKIYLRGNVAVVLTRKNLTISIWRARDTTLNWTEIGHSLEKMEAGDSQVPLGRRGAVGLWQHNLADLDGVQYLLALLRHHVDEIGEGTDVV